MKSVYHLAGIYESHRSKATTLKVSRFYFNECLPDRDVIILFKSCFVAFTSIFNHKHSIGHKHIPVQFLHWCLLKGKLNCSLLNKME